MASLGGWVGGSSKQTIFFSWTSGTRDAGSLLERPQNWSIFFENKQNERRRQNWSIQRRVSGVGVASESMLAVFLPLRESESMIYVRFDIFYSFFFVKKSSL